MIFDKLKSFFGLSKKNFQGKNDSYDLNTIKSLKDFEKYFDDIFEKGLLTKKEFFALSKKMSEEYGLKFKLAKKMVLKFCRKNKVVVER